MRSAFAVFLVMTLVFVTFQIWTGSLGSPLNLHDHKDVAPPPAESANANP